MFEDLMKISPPGTERGWYSPLAGAILGSMADRTPTTATPPGRVLVVDDEQPLAQMVASYLIRASFDTRQAHTGTQAVDEARRFSPDVVVLDLGLPELDGLEVCRRIRRQMLSDLAHEMGTPLSVLTVYLDGLQDGVVDWNNATHTIMADQLTRLTRLMEDIDDVSRAQEHRIDLDLAEEGLGDLLHTAAAAAGEAYADKGVDLQVETITDTARVLVDRQRFGQVMSNLLSNALRHTPAGGQVRISVHRQGASTALIHVADDGEGIPPGQLGHIFERFYRGDAARSRDNGGAGIGLTISKALIEAHGGTLTATSPGSDRGAVFALHLPLSSPDSEEAAR